MVKHLSILLIVVLIVLSAYAYDDKLCPNGCNKQGYCTSVTNTAKPAQCDCYPGFTGIDCSIRLCPSGVAWVDHPTANNVAHKDYTECSNMGICDRSSGTCSCRSGFGGPACDYLLCNSGQTQYGKSISNSSESAICSGNGRCMSLRHATTYQDFVLYENYEVYTAWDADMIMGCICDKGYEGAVCDRRSCPKGDDPATSGVTEIQLISCSCTTCIGGMYLSFRGEQTMLIPYDASITMIQWYLSKLSTLISFSVELLSGITICTPSGKAASVLQVTITLPTGKQPEIVVETSSGFVGKTDAASAGEYITLDNSLYRYYSRSATTEYIECSNHGSCNYDNGTCACFNGFRSSNGLGASGSYGDCGYKYGSNYVTVVNSSYSITSNCPVFNDAICSGHGICLESSSTCVCDTGFDGPACYNMTCTATTKTWFGDISSHSTLSTCGGIGYCNGETGDCYDCGGPGGIFYGSSCQYMSCYEGTNGQCNGNGVCLTMEELSITAFTSTKEPATFTYTTPWDASMIRGCACDRVRSVDNQYYTSLYKEVVNTYSGNITKVVGNLTDLTTRWYRGPYAYAATDWTGYNCLTARCPTGDDPRTKSQFNEVQTISCKANSGSFTLTFRGNTTNSIAYDATIKVLEAELEQLYTISKVKVYPDGTTANSNTKSVCQLRSDILVYIEFESEMGDVPLLIVDTSSLYTTPSYSPTIFVIEEETSGSREDIECSGNGICVEATGICSCMPGYMSSDGSLYYNGQTGDCSYVTEYF